MSTISVEQMLNKRIKPKPWKGEEARFKQIKLDGHRLTLVKGTEGELFAYGRKTEVCSSEKYPDIVNCEFWQYAKKEMPRGTIFDGEIYVVGGTSSDTTTNLVHNITSLNYTVFAVPMFNWSDLKFIAPDVALNRAIDCGLQTTSTFTMSPEDTREQLVKDALALDAEGWVLKNYNNHDWWKVKPEKEVDCIVTGFRDARVGKYFGGVGSLLISAYIDGVLTEIGAASGMDEETRWDIDETKDLGRVVEVQYECLASKGRLKHPRFVRWRDDKPASECVFERE